jgi:hypothetical protein
MVTAQPGSSLCYFLLRLFDDLCWLMINLMCLKVNLSWIPTCLSPEVYEAWQSGLVSFPQLNALIAFTSAEI